MTRLSENSRTWRSPAVIVVPKSLSKRVELWVSAPIEASPARRWISDVSPVAAPIASQTRVWRSRAKKEGSLVVFVTKCSYTCVRICTAFPPTLRASVFRPPLSGERLGEWYWNIDWLVGHKLINICAGHTKWLFTIISHHAKTECSN